MDLVADARGGFQWRVNACPHVGGGLAVSGDSLDALIWTGKAGATGLYHLRSSDGGERWGKPRLLGGAHARHGDIAALGDGSLAAVWDERDRGASAVFAAISKDGGKTWSAQRRVSPDGASGSHPRVVAQGGGFRAFWLQKAGNSATWASAPL